MKKQKFKFSKYSQNKRFINFLKKYNLNCNYFFKGNINCYSANCENINVVTFILESKNINLLGETDSFYSKYRTLRSEFREAIGLSNECQFERICPGIIIIPSEHTFKGSSIKKKRETPFGFKIENINSKSPRWLEKMRKKYGIKYVLKTKENYIIGPEEAFFSLAKNLLRKKEAKIYTEIGAGSGELSHYILENREDVILNINEASPHLKNHLKKYFIKYGDRINYLLKDIKKIDIPKSDVIFCGIFYGELPSLIKEKGKKIIDALGDKGLLVIQSAMPENLFALIILNPSLLQEIKKWRWYDDKYDLTKKFKYIKTIYLKGEIFILASQNKEIIKDALKNLNAKDFILKK